MPPKTSAENVIGRDHETDQPDEFAELAELTVQRGFRIAFFARGDGGSADFGAGADGGDFEIAVSFDGGGAAQDEKRRISLLSGSLRGGVRLADFDGRIGFPGQLRLVDLQIGPPRAPCRRREPLRRFRGTGCPRRRARVSESGGIHRRGSP